MGFRDKTSMGKWRERERELINIYIFIVSHICGGGHGIKERNDFPHRTPDGVVIGVAVGCQTRSSDQTLIWRMGNRTAVLLDDQVGNRVVYCIYEVTKGSICSL